MLDLKTGGGIPVPVIQPATELLRFSFKHIDLTTAKFLTENCDVEFFRELLVAVRDLSSWTIERFCDQNNNEHRHVIWFPQTTEPDGFRSVEADQLQYHECWQFQLSKKQDWRVHGILIDDTFYIVWLDPRHALYGE
jgi:hypothetical protein